MYTTELGQQFNIHPTTPGRAACPYRDTLKPIPYILFQNNHLRDMFVKSKYFTNQCFSSGQRFKDWLNEDGWSNLKNNLVVLLFLIQTHGLPLRLVEH